MSDKPFFWSSASRTDVGKVRSRNEDACLSLPNRGLWAVADGMGGHDAGDVASATIIEALAGVPRMPNLRSFVDEIEDQILDCNARLRTLAGSRGENCIVGATLVVLAVCGGLAVYLWAGDCRLYRYRRGQLMQLTQDHTHVEDLVSCGLLTRAAARTHPHANVVTRAVGASDALFLDIDAVPINDGDRFILCSDGLDKELEEDEMSAILARVANEEDSVAVESLIHLALERKGRDNITVVVATAHAAH